MAWLKTDCYLKKLGYSFFVNLLCCQENGQKSIILCFLFNRIIYYVFLLEFQVWLTKDEREHSVRVWLQKIVQKKLVMALESPFKWIIMLTQSN